MAQLHKLLFLAQLPPSPTPNMRMLLVGQYKHALFDRLSSPGSLKTEMHRLVMGTSESVGVLSEGGEGGEERRIGGLQPRRLQKALSELAGESIILFLLLHCVVMSHFSFYPQPLAPLRRLLVPQTSQRDTSPSRMISYRYAGHMYQYVTSLELQIIVTLLVGK